MKSISIICWEVKNQEGRQVQNIKNLLSRTVSFMLYAFISENINIDFLQKFPGKYLEDNFPDFPTYKTNLFHQQT